jgi:hypothetical protein
VRVVAIVGAPRVGWLAGWVRHQQATDAAGAVWRLVDGEGRGDVVGLCVGEEGRTYADEAASCIKGQGGPAVVCGVSSAGWDRGWWGSTCS